MDTVNTHIWFWNLERESNYVMEGGLVTQGIFDYTLSDNFFFHFPEHIVYLPAVHCGL